MDADASTWARDNLGWALLMFIAPIAAACFVYAIGVEWRVVIATCGVYAVTILLYAAIHLVRTPWKLDQERHLESENMRTAKVAAENQLRNVHTAKERKSDWEILENKFAKEPADYYAMWEKIDMENVGRTWMFGGALGRTDRDRFGLLLEEAGRLVLSSRYMKETYPQIFRLEDSMERWFETVLALEEPRGGIWGSGYVRNKITGKRLQTVNERIDNIAKHSSTACKRLAGQENWPPRL